MKKQQEVLNKKLMAGIVIGVTVFSVLLGAVIYLLDFRKAVASEDFSDGGGGVMVFDYGDGVVAYESPSPKAGIIFYAESKVEYLAYQNLMASIASRDFTCLLVEMPLNQPALGQNEAMALEMRCPNIQRWYMCGHGSGAKAAAAYAKKNTDIFEGVILLGGYSSADLNETGLKVISVYGSEDKIIDGAYKRNRSKLPSDCAELVIQGGCHAYFGSYGTHQGDGEPTISRAEQYQQAADFISSNIT